MKKKLITAAVCLLLSLGLLLPTVVFGEEPTSQVTENSVSNPSAEVATEPANNEGVDKEKIKEEIEAPIDASINETKKEIEKDKVEVAPASIGQSIKDTFPDSVLATQIANQVAGGDVNHMLTQSDIDQITELQISEFSSGGEVTDITGIGTLTSLNYLGIYFSKVTTIPSEIKNLKNLHTFTIGETPVKEIPKEIGELTNLVDFRVGKTQVATLPKEISNLTKLEKLLIQDNSKDFVFPDINFNFPQLKELYLSGFDVKTILPGLKNSLQIGSLGLEKSGLEELPIEVVALKETLGGLFLGGNNLKVVPDKFQEMNALKYLDLSSNQIEAVPDWVNSKKYGFLDLDFNKIHTLSQESYNSVGLQSQKYSVDYGAVEQIPVLGVQILSYEPLKDAILMTLLDDKGKEVAVQKTNQNGKWVFSNGELINGNTYKLVTTIKDGALKDSVYEQTFKYTKGIITPGTLPQTGHSLVVWISGLLCIVGVTVVSRRFKRN